VPVEPAKEAMVLIWDESFMTVMEAAEAEARRSNASAYGSEHVLLGLLSVPDAVTGRVLADRPELTVEAVRHAVAAAVDDAPHLKRLGIDPELLRQAERAAPPGPRVDLRNRHTAELQVALDDSSHTCGQLVKRRQLPLTRKLGSAHLWLAVLEPTSRAHRLLNALDVDPDQVRVTVLTAMAAPGSPPPAWPGHLRRGLLDRVLSRFFERVNVAG